MKTFATEPREESSFARPCAVCGGFSFRPLWDCGSFSFVRCDSCGLVQQNPQPVQESVLARYDQTYLAYEIERQFNFRDLELLALGDLHFEEEAAAIGGDSTHLDCLKSFLDVGCATGALLAHFREGGWTTLGVEPCEPAARYGRERFGLEIMSCTLEKACLPAGSFGVVHASHLIEHLNEPESFLDEARRILVPGGLLSITTPNADGLQARLFGSEWRSAIYDHLHLFSKGNLVAFLEARGFKVIRSVTWGGWAKGRKPDFLKVPLDWAAKRLGFGDVVALLARRA